LAGLCPVVERIPPVVWLTKKSQIYNPAIAFCSPQRGTSDIQQTKYWDVGHTHE
jgi:hypothetical protein